MKKVFLLSLLTPTVALASGITDLIDSVYGIVNGVLIPIAFGLCVFYFFWGIFKYIKNESESEKAEGRSIMTWGVFGIFVAFSVWGIIILIRDELGLPRIDNVDKQTVFSTDSVIKP